MAAVAAGVFALAGGGDLDLLRLEDFEVVTAGPADDDTGIPFLPPPMTTDAALAGGLMATLGAAVTACVRFLSRFVFRRTVPVWVEFAVSIVVPRLPVTRSY
jgi:hypothetical protein